MPVWRPTQPGPARASPGRFNTDAVPIAKVGANTAQVQQLLDRVGFKHDRGRAVRTADAAGQGALIDTWRVQGSALGGVLALIALRATRS